MRAFLSLASLSVSALVFCSTAALAQFQNSTPEELKMTADPKYPDAAAVILNYEEKVDDQVHYTSRYSRVKILKDSARDLGTVHIQYLFGGAEVGTIQARTIQPDDTIVPLAMKPADLMQSKQGGAELHDVVFNLPAVQTGSIIEYYYQIRYGEKNGGFGNRSDGSCSQPQWQIQGDYPVRKAHYVFTPCAGIFGSLGVGGLNILDERGVVLTDLLWYRNLPNKMDLKPSVAHRFELSLDDIPPLPNEPWMPPSDSQRYQVRFYYGPGQGAASYWNNAAQGWLRQVDRFAEPGGTLKAFVNDTSPAILPPLERAKKLYAAVQTLENTDFTRTKGAAELRAQGQHASRRAEDTWNAKSGDSDEIAMLYLAMLRAAGLNARPVRVADRAHTLFNVNFLYFDQLEDTVIVLNIDGKDTLLDPGAKFCPFGLISWRHSGAGGIRPTDKGTEPWITPLNQYSDNVLTRRADLTVAPDGRLTGKLQFGMTGQDALRWRQASLSMDEGGLKQQFDNWLRTQVPLGLEAHLDHFTNLQDPTAELGGVAIVSGTIGSTTGKRIILPASFFRVAESRRFTEQPNRQWPVDMQYAAQVKDGVVYHLPAGYSVEGTTPTANVPWPQHAVYIVKSTPGANTLTVVDTLTRAFTFLLPDEYASLRDFYQKVGEASQQQIVLTAGATAAGN